MSIISTALLVILAVYIIAYNNLSPQRNQTSNASVNPLDESIVLFVAPSGYDYAIILPNSTVIDRERWMIPPNMNLVMKYKFNEDEIFRQPFPMQVGESTVMAPFTAVMYYVDENGNGEMDVPTDLHFGRIVGCGIKPEFRSIYPEGCTYPDSYMVPGSYLLFASLGGNVGEWIEYDQIEAIFVFMFNAHLDKVTASPFMMHGPGGHGAHGDHGDSNPESRVPTAPGAYI